MKHTRSILAATLALSLAACSQQTTTPEASAPADAIAGAYLVGFKQGNLSSQSVTEQAAVQAQAIAAAGGIMTSQWVDISAAAVKLDAAALAKLRANPSVEYVEPDYVRTAQGFKAGVTDSKISTGLSAQTLTAQALYAPSGEFTWGDNALRVQNLRASGYTGTGVAVCVGDTGIDGNHPEFGRKLKGFKNFVTTEANRNDPYALNDVSHHGTHVSGTIFAQLGAGTGASGTLSGMDANGVVGVATGVNLYMARVLGNTGSGSSSGIINGVNWCAAQLKSQGGTENKVVISLSLGGGSKSQTEQRAYTSVWQKGALTIAATGNDGAAVSYPAAYTEVVAIGAVDSNLAKADFSNFGTQVDLVGPGVDVISTVPLGQGSQALASGGGVSFTEVKAADLTGKGSFTGNIVAAGGTNNEFCGTTTRNAALAGNIALIARGTCSFEEKTANAVASGAKAVMIYNNAAGALGMTLTNSYTVPVVGILQADGQALLGKLPTTGTAAVTSADYESYNGTSMATPHVSAAAAVVWAAKPTLTNTQLLSLLTSTAKDLGTAGKDNNFGYGLVDPLKAITGQ
ncbi:S8 family serine peptidase [Deinococcus soli (ex Cha et al. 2016)]|uniref:Subtilisin family serine protease n=2 Tax=Deinococcus soli (ex Cha et al. 2016) TaxID=1309411 RepID=A0ACC6KAX5_9DEIO|nr:S8 family serine peptidase [Deinococcus soli (ex Cha et al. 2016)]MDR6216511.1 subtilisin family serine protease [Deinococcus soli (ex Cha et al. 2016)]MDR6327332.1 subtilisin family serine protease [Deinococcus soli (ex Cha et al. 2016)]MDR6749607.1 subtilisin family serine protease [Deinococcus soli (ex Cha et al. 2016)]